MTIKYSFYIHILLLIFCLAAAVNAQYDDKPREKKPGKQVEQQRQQLKSSLGEKYRWPLNINNGYSSSFQEFRSNHFHGGFDLRTHQKTGYPVYAIADGRIYKIRMVKRGSGRGLYLKHDDGYTSIYFHLDRFEKKIENVLKRVQHIKGKKYIENYFLKKPLYYKRGQIIGYSGETGAGLPHLHVEIRDKDYFALNPFKLVELPGKDKRNPVLKGLLFRTRGDSPINGKIGESYFKFQKKGNGFYALNKTLLVTGNFDLVLNVYDWSDTGKKVAPYFIFVLIDGRLYFRLHFERFQRDDNNQLGFVYDMFHSNASTFYFNLFSQEGFLLEQENTPLEQIIKNLDYGKHELKIMVEDNYNNISTGVVPFYKIQNPKFEISNIEVIDGKNENENKVLLDIKKLNAHPSGDIKINIFDDSDSLISTAALNHHRITGKKPIRLNGVPADAFYIDFDFHFQDILYFKKKYLLKKDHLTNITAVPFDSFINRDEVFIKVKDTTLSSQNIKLNVIQGKESKLVDAQCSGSFVYFRFKPMNRENRVLLHFSILKDNEKVVEIQEKLNLIYLEEGVEQGFKYHEFEAEFDARSVYEPKVLKVEEKDYRSEFPILSRQVSLSPYHFPFLDTVFYIFKKKLPNPRQVGIFKYNPKTGKWRSRYTTYDAVTTTYKRRLISSGIFALLRDIFPPRIWFIMPRTRYKKNFKWLIVKIADKGKGVDDETIKIWLNGQGICPKYECEYDPDRNSLKIEDLRRLRVGRNLIKVQVKDYAGNNASRIFRFNLR